MTTTLIIPPPPAAHHRPSAVAAATTYANATTAYAIITATRNAASRVSTEFDKSGSGRLTVFMSSLYVHFYFIC
jgi:hypothetical protein